MMEKLELLMIGTLLRMEGIWDDFLHEEKGASDIVAILVVIVILIAVAGIFRGQLITLVETVFSKVTEFVEQ